MAKAKNLPASWKPETDVDRLIWKLEQESEQVFRLARNLNILDKCEVAEIKSLKGKLTSILASILNSRTELSNRIFLIEISEILNIEYPSTYEQKKDAARKVRTLLSEQGLAFAMPRDEVQLDVDLGAIIHDPHVIYAIASRDGNGRFVFENRNTKKRINTTDKPLDVLKGLLTIRLISENTKTNIEYIKNDKLLNVVGTFDTFVSLVNPKKKEVTIMMNNKHVITFNPEH